jgi:integrase
MRRAEVVSLNRADVEDGYASEVTVVGKHDKQRVVFLDEPAQRAIRAYLAERADAYAPLFIRHDDGRGRPGERGVHWRLDPQSVNLTVKKYAALVGVASHPHQLRHLAARTWLNEGANIGQVQALLGHSDPGTTSRIYARYTTKTLHEAFDTFSRSAEEVARRARQARRSSA